MNETNPIRGKHGSWLVAVTLLILSAHDTAAKDLLTKAGFASQPEPVSRSSYTANEKGLRAHRSGDYGQAKEFFTEAVHLSPGHLLARYNLVCAQARLGELQAAFEGLQPLLETDLYQFLHRFRSDPDLEGLRQSVWKKRLDRQVDVLEKAWQEAARRGLPAVLLAGERDEVGIFRAKLLRPGFYVHDVRRFFPSSPPVEGATSAVVDRDHRQTIWVKPRINDCRYDLCPRIESFEIFFFSFPPQKEPRQKWSYHFEESMGGELQLSLTSHALHAKVLEDCGREDCQSPSYRIGLPDVGGGAKQGPSSRSTLFVDYRGSELSHFPDGYSVEKGSLSGPGSLNIALGPRHIRAKIHQVLPSPGGKKLLVASTADGCDCDHPEQHPVFEHTVSLIDLEGQRVSQIFAGRGDVVSRMDAGGAVYLQTGDQKKQIRRWTSIDRVGKETGEPLMEGLSLLPTRVAKGNCCGL